MDFLSCNKHKLASTSWKSILDQRYVVRKSMVWFMGNGKSINFWYGNWMEDSPLIDEFTQICFNISRTIPKLVIYYLLQKPGILGHL